MLASRQAMDEERELWRLERKLWWDEETGNHDATMSQADVMHRLPDLNACSSAEASGSTVSSGDFI